MTVNPLNSTYSPGSDGDLGLGAAFALALQPLRNDEGKLERLVGIEPRIAMGVVAVGQIRLGHGLGAADAFGDVLPGHLDMDAAGMGAFARDGCRRRSPPRAG